MPRLYVPFFSVAVLKQGGHMSDLVPLLAKTHSSVSEVGLIPRSAMGHDCWTPHPIMWYLNTSQ